MGAEPWGEFTPYRPDIQQALDALQEEVFRRGDYTRPYADISFLDDLDFFDVTEEEREAMLPQYNLTALRAPMARMGVAGLRRWLQDLNSAPQLQSREELEALACLSADGTASVLDMHAITAQPTGGAVCPLPASERLRLYGTERPTRDMVKQNSGYYDNIRRGQGIYCVVYQDDRPSEIYFAGYSYD